ncbi:MAG: KH domain-containing protein [Verrucomicrobia bacterium]|nr:KH domain-containing protein [Verrucomicrobiota bacterium]
MQQWLEFAVRGLVDRPDAVSVTPVDREGTMHFELRLHPSDVGKVIGRQGATIQALRALLQVGAAKKGLRCSVDIVEEATVTGSR